MRKEYDFTKGTRGKHAEKRLRIVGDGNARHDPDAALRIQKIIERDLKTRADFRIVWNELNNAQKKSIRTAWLEKINSVLANQ
jgi:hypothetical protein